MRTRTDKGKTGRIRAWKKAGRVRRRIGDESEERRTARKGGR